MSAYLWCVCRSFLRRIQGKRRSNKFSLSRSSECFTNFRQPFNGREVEHWQILGRSHVELVHCRTLGASTHAQTSQSQHPAHLRELSRRPGQSGRCELTVWSESLKHILARPSFVNKTRITCVNADFQAYPNNGCWTSLLVLNTKKQMGGYRIYRLKMRYVFVIIRVSGISYFCAHLPCLRCGWNERKSGLIRDRNGTRFNWSDYH